MSPACACSAPQQTCSVGDSTWYPFTRSTRLVAALTLPNSPSPTQPLNNIAFRADGLAFNEGKVDLCSAPPELSNNANAKAKRCGNSFVKPDRRNNQGSRESRKILVNENNSFKRRGCSQTCRRTALSKRYSNPRPTLLEYNSKRLDSSKSPYSTPAGQTLSQARQPRQRSI